MTRTALLTAIALSALLAACGAEPEPPHVGAGPQLPPPQQAFHQQRPNGPYPEIHGFWRLSWGAI